MKKMLDIQLGLDPSIHVPIELPCHSYALGLLMDYEIGELIGSPVTQNTSDYIFLQILSDELKTLGSHLLDDQYGKISNPNYGIRAIQITRMQTCGDYHFYLIHEDHSISHKYRHFKQTYSSTVDLVPGEYSLGTYLVHWAL